MCRIRSKTLKSLVFDLFLPFIFGFLLMSLIFNHFLGLQKLQNASENQEQTLRIGPLGINLNPNHSSTASMDSLTWANLELKSSQKNITLWIVTPTYCRGGEQLPELTRLAQALWPIKSQVKWLIYDEYEKCGEKNIEKIRNLLQPFGLNFWIFRTEPLDLERIQRKVPYVGKGVMGRRTAIDFLREENAEGILYFADDDNTYDSEIFYQMLSITKVGVFPVGAMSNGFISSPIVKNGKVIDFHDGFKENRKFPMDFAGFAINLRLIHENPEVNLKYSIGYMETYFLLDLHVEIEDLEPLASNCTKILTWHTQSNRQIREYNEKMNSPMKSFLDLITYMNRPIHLNPFLSNSNIPLLYSRYVPRYSSKSY